MQKPGYMYNHVASKGFNPQVGQWSFKDLTRGRLGVGSLRGWPCHPLSDLSHAITLWNNCLNFIFAVASADIGFDPVKSLLKCAVSDTASGTLCHVGYAA